MNSSSATYQHQHHDATREYITGKHIEAESLAAMLEKEHNDCRKGKGYLDPLEPTIITASDRMAIIDWNYGVVDALDICREVVAVAMDMVDRYLSEPSNCFTDQALHDQNKFQLLSVTALYVAIKVHEQVPLSSNVFAEISQGLYTIEDIEDMELILLSGISWRCNAPIASQVGSSILNLILPLAKCSNETKEFLLDEMTYLSELAVRDYYLSMQRSSTVALAAIFNAIGRIRGREGQELLLAFLCIAKQFDFDKPEVIEESSKKLLRQLKEENPLAIQEEMCLQVPPKVKPKLVPSVVIDRGTI